MGDKKIDYSNHSYSYRVVDTGYMVEYASQAGKIPVELINNFDLLGPFPVEKPEIKNQRIYIGIGTKAITQQEDQYLRWFSRDYPMEEPAVLMEDAGLMPFPDILDIFRSILPAQNKNIKEMMLFKRIVSAKITQITLREMYIQSEDAEDSGYYIPVWDFEMDVKGSYEWIGEAESALRLGQEIDESEYRSPKGVSKIVMTINAIDGSIMNRITAQ